MSTVDPTPEKAPAPTERRRRRKKNSGRRDTGALLRRWGADLSVLFLLVGTLMVIGFSVAARSGAAADDWAAPLLWPALIVLAVVDWLTLMRLRLHINGVQRWWMRTGCPECRRAQLRRVRRRPLDRLVGRLGIPVRRYHCSNCKWQGLRIDETRT